MLWHHEIMDIALACWITKLQNCSCAFIYLWYEKPSIETRLFLISVNTSFFHHDFSVHFSLLFVFVLEKGLLFVLKLLYLTLFV